MARGHVGAIQLRLAFQDVERTFGMAGVQVDLRIRLQIQRDIERAAEHLHRRFLAVRTTGDHA